MATRTHVVSRNPVDIVDALSLVKGTAYHVQGHGGDLAHIQLAVGTDRPRPNDRGHSIRPGEVWTVIARTEPIWIWCEIGSTIAVTEAHLLIPPGGQRRPGKV